MVIKHLFVTNLMVHFLCPFLLQYLSDFEFYFFLLNLNGAFKNLNDAFIYSNNN